MSKPLLSDAPLSGRVGDLDPQNMRFELSLHGLLLTLARAFKRALDVTVSSILLLMSIPVFLAVAVLVALDGGPVFFLHKRVGRNGETFGCIKFRTMILGAEECLDEYLFHHPEAQMEWAREQKLSFDPRITAIGRFLRLSSVDEIPQLLNVLKGDMSLVGPRPVTQGKLVHYGFATPLYKSVRPDIYRPVAGQWSQ